MTTQVTFLPAIWAYLGYRLLRLFRLLTVCVQLSASSVVWSHFLFDATSLTGPRVRYMSLT